MLISTPVRSIFDTHASAGWVDDGKYVSFNADDKERRKAFFPWESDTFFSEPLLFEARQTTVVDSVRQLYRFAVYAALSGEPVHAFIANQRKCNASFLCEEMPTFIKEILTCIINGEGGISRNNLVRLIRVLDIFRLMLDKKKIPDGMSALQSIPKFGWWAISHVSLRSLSKGNMSWESVSKKINLSRKEFPMNEYDRFFESLVSASVKIYLPRLNRSDNEFTFMLRGALKTWQSQSVFNRETIKFAIMSRLRADVARKSGGTPKEKDLMEYSEAAIAIFEKGEAESEMNSTFIRFLLGAYEGAYRHEVEEERKRKKTEDKGPGKEVEKAIVANQ